MFYITIVNFVPTTAGLASSASAFAALSYAAVKAANLNLDDAEISKIARVGSGSASRSIYGGFALWQTGDHDTSIAKKLDINWPEFRIIVCLLNADTKTHSSSSAMKQSVENELVYSKWVNQSRIDLDNMIDALSLKDIDQVGSIAQSNSNPYA